MSPVTSPLRLLIQRALLVACGAIILISSASAPRAGTPALPAALRARLTVPEPPFAGTAWHRALEEAVLREINPDDYVCAPTDFNIWIDGKFAAIQNFGPFIDVFFNLGAWFWVFEYTLAFDQNASDEYIGIDGRKTQELQKRHRDGQRFWNVPTQDVLLQGSHGSILADDAKMVRVVQRIFPVSPAEAQLIVDYVQSVIQNDPGLGFENPLFTLNAFAFTERGEPAGSPYIGLPDKIVMGDGIIQALADLGLDANAPDMVHAHEFGHHVQFELGLVDNFVPGPEALRRIELMADAFGAYFSAHSRGSAFQTKRITDVFRASYLVGDCAFDNPGHHGTPNQREAAAKWAANLAKSAKNQGHIYSSALMRALFDEQLPNLVAPDAP